MKKKLLSIFMALALLPAGTAAGSSQDRGDAVTLIVELKGEAVLEAENASKMGVSLFSVTDEAQKIEANVTSAQKKTMSAIKRIDKKASRVFSYTYVLNGFSVEAYEYDIEKIKSLPEVEEVYISKHYTRVEPIVTEAAAEEVYAGSGCDMINVPYLHSRGYRGQGHVLAVIDSEFDTNHEIFQGKIENPKLTAEDIGTIIEEKGLNADVSANMVYKSEKIPFAYNYSDDSSDVFYRDEGMIHGTHVAGTAAGNNGKDPSGGTFTGAAPDAQVLMMQVPDLDDSKILAALDDSVKMGAEVINLSIGSAYEENYGAEQRAYENASSAGVLLSVASGNDGRGNPYSLLLAPNQDYSSSGTPACFSAATSVASVNDTRGWKKYYKLRAGEAEIPYNNGNPEISFAERFSDAEYEYVYCGSGGSTDFEGLDLTGKIAVVERFDNDAVTNKTKFRNAQNANAAGAVYISNTERVNYYFAQEVAGDLPIAYISHSDGQLLKAAENKTLISDSVKSDALIHYRDMEMSDFSSWGVNSSLELKPEITAPGGGIYSSVPNNKYDVFNGTSMAAPHMSGASILMRQYIDENEERYNRSGNKASLAENLIMSTAEVLYPLGSGIPYSPRYQGAGLIDLEAAAKTDVILKGDGGKSKISLKEIGDTFNVSFKAENFSDEDIVYDNSSIMVMNDGVDGNGTIGDSQLFFFMSDMPESITVKADGETDIDIEVQLDGEDIEKALSVFENGFFVDGYVFLESSDKNIPPLSIPFTGFYGDWAKAAALDKPLYDGNTMYGKTYLGSGESCGHDMNENGIYEDMCIPLGTNTMLSGNESYWEYASEEYAGISPNGDGEYDYLCVNVNPIRTARNAVFEILNSHGDTVMSDEVSMLMKNSPNCTDFLEDGFKHIDDGDYTARVMSSFNYEGAAEESIEMRFYIDREAPDITALSFREDGGKTMLDVSAADNRYLMGIRVEGRYADGKDLEINTPIKGLSEASESFDVTGLDLSSLKVTVCDYAHNNTVRTYEGIDVTLKEETVGRSKITNTLGVNNMTGEDIEALMCMALYRNGVLVGLSEEDGIIEADSTVKTFEFPRVIYDSAKVFIWESADSMKPICGTFEFAH